ncbi:MAG TPA: zinc-dependent metalloprotease family protein, partial [Gemmatimonadales bacterium]|nr:zinc-dependent metalloprotease family protein [Gemmatimonadales bacterium]
MPLTLPWSGPPSCGTLRAGRIAAAAASLALLIAACGGGGGGTGGGGAQIQLTVSGLPSGTAGSVTVSGPNGFSRTVSASGAITNLAGGSYSIAAAAVENDTARYSGAPAAQTVSVDEGEVQPATVAYAVSTGRITVTILGLPVGVDASVRVVRAPGFAQTISHSATLSKLTPGSYTVTADTVEDGGTDYPGVPRVQTVGITAGYTPAQATVNYGPQPGSLRVVVNGLPVAIPADITVSGPGGFTRAVTATTTLEGLPSGTYTIAAGQASSGGDVFNPTPTSQQASVTTGTQAQAPVTYASANGQTLNLSIGRFYITQSVQRPDNSVALVAGRQALARVFVVANQANSAAPQVRLRWFQGATQVREDFVNAPGGSVPLAVDEADLGTSWNLHLPPSFLVPGLRVEVLVDPANGIAESAESDNGTLPGSQSGLLAVTTTTSFNVTMVPIVQDAVSGDPAGDVSQANLDLWLDFTRRIHPLSAVDATVRAPYVTQTVVQNSGASWTSMLSEFQALKASESTRYYYGVLHVNYGSGIAGIGYVPFFGNDAAARAALGWDHQPSGAEVAAHEWGHNFGRGHAPCDVAQTGDWSSNPVHAGGSIGNWGWDNVTNVTRSPDVYTDVMGYCQVQWISDYTYERVLNFRAGVSYAEAGAAVEGVLVWGRIEDGRVTLEPAFAISAPAAASAGDWTVEAVDEAGAPVGTRRFAAAPVADLPGDVRTFAFVLPLDAARRDRVTT